MALAGALVPLLLAAPPGAPGPAALRELGAAGLAAVRAGALSAHVRFLSSDLLGGRGTATPGHALAELYVSAEMEAAGLEPGGPEGSWLQPVPLRAWRVDHASSRLALHGPSHPLAALVPDEDFVLLSDGEHGEVELDGPLAFAGYAVSAPEYGYDDLRGADFRGKVAVVLHGAPLSERKNFFPPTAHALYSDRREKVRRLAERGAVGVLFVYTPDWEESLPWEDFVRNSRAEGMGWLEGGRLGSGVRGVLARGVLSARGFAKVLAAAGIPGGAKAVLEKAAANRLVPQEWMLRARIRSRAEIREAGGANVLGMLRGSDPALASEVVVIAAHLDHLGEGEPVGGDGIYNGALDNASGVAVLLEVARAFAALPARPARSLLFAAVTGEEKGLLGSEYLALHPPVARDRVVAGLNVDGAPGPFPLEDAVARGAEHSTLGRAAQEAAEALGVPLSPDPAPRAHVLVRSDQYSFVRAGVPALIVGPGHQGADAEARRAWYRARYHQPSDEWEPTWDWEAMARFARLQFLTALAVAQSPDRPRWNEGDLLAPGGKPGRR